MTVGYFAQRDLQQRARLLTALYVAEQQFGHLSPEAISRVAERLQMSEGEVVRTASFYSMYRTQATGRYLIQVCEGLSCFLAGGAESLVEGLEKRLGIKVGQTSADGLFTLATVPCLAACDVSPAMRVNDTLYTQLTEDRLDTILQELRGE